MSNPAYFLPVLFSSDDDQEGVMDNLLEALKTGQAFNVNRGEKKEGRRRTPRAAGGKDAFRYIHLTSIVILYNWYFLQTFKFCYFRALHDSAKMISFK